MNDEYISTILPVSAIQMLQLNKRDFKILCLLTISFFETCAHRAVEMEY
jgi:hypothetical protein